MTPSRALYSIGFRSAFVAGLPHDLCVPSPVTEFAHEHVGPVDPGGEPVNEEWGAA